MNARRVAGGAAATIAGGAALIAVISILARVVGFGRQLVFQGTVSETALGSVYQTANALPNVAFEIVAGGALASVVVPLLAAAAMRGDRAHVRQVSSALLGWTLVVLVPVALVGVVLAGPVMRLMLGDAGGDVGIDLGRRMLLIFLPQIPLYGVAVVTAGVLQAHRRFLAAALAPVLSSVVVASAYVVFQATFVGDRDDLDTVTAADEWILAGGTTLGVLALALGTFVPMLIKVTGLTPTLRFPAGEAARARRLAAAGIATLIAQQVAYLAAIAMANHHGPRGAWVTYVNSWMVYLLPYAVLALPIATATFPRLSQYAQTDTAAYRGTLARSARAVVVVALTGSAVLVAAAWPIAEFFAHLSQAGVGPDRMAWTLMAFAPGLVGYGLVAHLGRALYARNRGRAAATAIVAGWLTSAVFAVALAATVPTTWVVPALGLAHSVGMTVGGALLVRAVLRDDGGGALAGVGRAFAVALVGGSLGGAVGLAVAAALRAGPLVESVAGTVVAGVVCGILATGCVIVALSLGDRAVLRMVMRR